MNFKTQLPKDGNSNSAGVFAMSAVFINGRTVVHCKSAGQVFSTSVNLTGTLQIPIPYINRALSKDAVNAAKTIFVEGNPLCHKQSYFSCSKGDEAGSFGGIFSGTVNGRAEFITGSANVFLEGQAAVREGDLMVSNYRNTEPAQLQQSQGLQATLRGDEQTVSVLMTEESLQVSDWQLYGTSGQLHNTVLSVICCARAG